MRLGVIVEGHGDVSAIPLLIRRVSVLLGKAMPDIPSPHRVPRSKFAKESEVRRAVELMARKAGPDGPILLVLDADDDCPAQLGPCILEWAQNERRDRRISVVMANREFEAWFLGAAHSLRGKRGLPGDLEPPLNPEDVRDAKGWISCRMPHGYSETIDQPALAQSFDLDVARRCCPSFDKLVRDLDRLLHDG